MVGQILAFLAQLTVAVITSAGYGGIFLLMAVGSANIPIPSEIVLPFSGFLAGRGIFEAWIVIIVAVVGDLVGSLVSYALAGWVVGKRSRSAFVRFLIPQDSLERAQQWYARWGGMSVLVGKLLPIVRMFSSLPAGLARMNAAKFVAYSLAGSVMWVVLLVWGGMTLGQHWERVSMLIKQFDVVVVALIILVVAVWVRNHFGDRMGEREK